MKKLFVLGLIVALLLFSLPVLAENGDGTAGGGRIVGEHHNTGTDRGAHSRTGTGYNG